MNFQPGVGQQLPLPEGRNTLQYDGMAARVQSEEEEQSRGRRDLMRELYPIVDNRMNT